MSVPNGHDNSPPDYTVWTRCRPCALATMSVCPLLSSSNVSRWTRPEDCQLYGPYTYLHTRLYKPNALPLPYCQSLWTWPTESGRNTSSLDWSTIRWPAVTFFRRETCRRISVLLHLLTWSLPQTQPATWQLRFANLRESLVVVAWYLPVSSSAVTSRRCRTISTDFSVF